MQVEVQNQLRQMAREVVSQISALESLRTKELLGVFVSELFAVVAEADSKAKRRQRQAEGIAAAKARGVRFGRPSRPLPEGYPSAYRRWKAGAISGAAAARECGMPLSTFRYRAAGFEDAQR